MNKRTGRSIHAKPSSNDTPGSSLDEALALVRKAMTENEMTQSDLAEALGLSRPYLNQFLNGRQKVSDDIVKAICAQLQLPGKVESALLAANKESTEEVPDSTVAKIIDRQAQEREVWVILPYFVVAEDKEARKELIENLRDGTKYIFWSSRRDSLIDARRAIKQEIELDEELRKNATDLLSKLICIQGPQWLDVAPWRLHRHLPPEAFFLRTIRGRMEADRAGDSWIADRLFALLNPVLAVIESERSYKEDAPAEFELVRLEDEKATP